MKKLLILLLVICYSCTLFSQNSMDDTIIAKGEISIYPNPAADVITVANEGVNSVAVYSLAGFLVASSESNVVNVANLVNGIYVVKANTEAGVITGQIIKKGDSIKDKKEKDCNGGIRVNRNFAQQATSTQRLKFMGKSMDCSVLEMATHLQTKGCSKIIEEKEGFILMKGTFQGYENCYFNLVEEYNILDHCSVVIQCNYEDYEDARVYNDIVKRLTQKYGVPSESGNPSSSCYRFTEIGGKCNHYNIFFIKGGAIKVVLVSWGLSRSVWIVYEDSISKNKIEKIQQDEL